MKKSFVFSDIKVLVVLAIVIVIIVCMSILFYPISIEQHDIIYTYEGVDCYITFDVNQSLSNVSEIINMHGFSSEIWYKRSSPAGTGEIVDFIRFSYNYSSLKNNSGYVYNFDTDNLTIKLHYYPDDHPDREKTYKTEEEARSLTYSRYLKEKLKFEPDVDYIISIFDLKLNSNPRSVDFVQLIEYST